MKRLFTWNSTYDIGVDSMNHQHQRLIDIMNTLYEQNQQGKPKALLLKTLVHLQEFTIKHFKEEESFMSSIHYTELERHQLVHKNLLYNLEDLIIKFKKSDSEKITEEFFEFLTFWLKSHIKGIDTRYGRFYKGKAS